MMVSKRSQRQYIRRIKALLRRINSHKNGYTLDDAEISMVCRALVLHMTVIKMDIERKRNEP